MFEEFFDRHEMINRIDYLIDWSRFRKPISGTYKNNNPAADKTILELRVDVDGRRPMMRMSGDIFKRRSFLIFDEFLATPGQQLLELERFTDLQIARLPYFYTSYEYSFIIEDVTEDEEAGTAVLTGPIIYCHDPSRVDETIEVRIKRVNLFAESAGAVVNIFKSGYLVSTYCLDKISDYFRKVNLEIDRFQGTSYPPSVDTDLDPSPGDLPVQTVTTQSVFRNAGIDLIVDNDDVLNDPDSDDPGDNWSEGELHDLMEDRYDRFANTLQWNLYGVVVPRFGDPNYNSGYYGTMFDWGGWQMGDTYFRQGCAIAEEALLSRSVGSLYNNSDKQDRLILETFIHEVGHSFNLPHTWSRSGNPSSSSNSFMNYPWGYTGGGGESGFWSDFRWEFDDVELIWMRHQCRNDVIFGGTDWIGNNLSVYLEPQAEIHHAPLKLSLSADPVLDFAEPVRIELKLTNVSKFPQLVADRLDLQDQFVSLYIRRPNGAFVRYIPPVLRLKGPGDLVTLEPGESIQNNVLVSFSAKGLEFHEPGEYRLRAYYGQDESDAIVSSALRLRVSTPKTREDEDLGHLLFDVRAAKFLYFDGSERYPQIVDNLQEAVAKYRKTHPRVVRHLNAALGVHLSRTHKQVKMVDGRRVIVARTAQNREAVSCLKASLIDLPVSRYFQLANRLGDAQIANNRKADARETFEKSIDYLKEYKADERLIEKMRKRAKGLPRRKKR
jgi:hypothetical protein